MYDLIDIETIKGKQIGKGTKKTCFRHLQYPERCIKICSKEDQKYIKMEVDYLLYLKSRGIKGSFVPEIYDTFSTNTHIGMIEECFLDKNHGGVFDEAFILKSYFDQLDENSTEFCEIVSMLKNIKLEMISKNIIVSDLHLSNFLFVRKENSKKIVIIDGYGITEFIPFPKHFRFFGRKKVMRQWNKLIERTPRLAKYCP